MLHIRCQDFSAKSPASVAGNEVTNLTPFQSTPESHEDPALPARSFGRFIIAMSSLIMPAFVFAAETGGEQSLLESAIYRFESLVFWTVPVPFVGVEIEAIVLWLAIPMLIFTFYFRGVNFRCLGQATRILRGKYYNPDAPGEVTQFQALSTALSATVGLGNIAGVAVAIGYGGAGAVFWMIVVGFLAMTLKFLECTLGVKYRIEHDDGTVSGGPMMYLERGLQRQGYPRLGKVLAISYAIPALFSTLTFFQINQAYEQANAVAHFDHAVLFALTFGLLAAVVIIGGVTSIAKIASRLVPLMCGVYVLAALIVIGANLAMVPSVFMNILTSAFSPQAVEGGLIGVLVIGMRRAVSSSEAGLGSAAIAHAAAKTDEPISEGLVALYEPFVDTVIICTMTALVILITGADSGIETGVAMTSSAFGSVVAWFPWILALAVLLFAYSTVITWSYYGETICVSLFGYSKVVVYTWRLAYCIITPAGALIASGAVIAFLDSVYFLMAVPNVIGLYFLAPEIKADLADYLRRVKDGSIPLRVAAE